MLVLETYEFINDETRQVWECLCARITGEEWAEQRLVARFCNRLENGMLNGRHASEQLGEILWQKFSETFQSTNIYWNEIAQAALFVSSDR